VVEVIHSGRGRRVVSEEVDPQSRVQVLEMPKLDERDAGWHACIDDREHHLVVEA
jgi:hypothetical protein